MSDISPTSFFTRIENYYKSKQEKRQKDNKKGSWMVEKEKKNDMAKS